FEFKTLGFLDIPFTFLIDLPLLTDLFLGLLPGLAILERFLHRRGKFGLLAFLVLFAFPRRHDVRVQLFHHRMDVFQDLAGFSGFVLLFCRLGLLFSGLISSFTCRLVIPLFFFFLFLGVLLAFVRLFLFFELLVIAKFFLVGAFLALGQRHSGFSF